MRPPSITTPATSSITREAADITLLNGCSDLRTMGEGTGTGFWRVSHCLTRTRTHADLTRYPPWVDPTRATPYASMTSPPPFPLLITRPLQASPPSFLPTRSSSSASAWPTARNTLPTPPVGRPSSPPCASFIAKVHPYLPSPPPRQRTHHPSHSPAFPFSSSTAASPSASQA